MDTTQISQEQKDMLTQATERALKPHYDEFVKRTTELYKQSERYKEHMRRKKTEKTKGDSESQT